MNVKNPISHKRNKLYNFLQIPIATPEFLEAKYQDHRMYTIRMLLLTAVVASGLWIWDFAHDPGNAGGTWLIRTLMGVFPAICAMVIIFRKPARQFVQWIIIFSSIAEAILFFMVTTYISGAMESGNEGYMINLISVLLMTQGCSFPLIIAGHIITSIVPHMMALAIPHTGFIHLKYAILLWPVNIAILIAQYFMYVQYGRNWLLRQKLEEMASHDTLTGLLNRRAFIEHANHIITLTKRHWNRYLAILMIDADNFKSINDTYGHDTGDRVLLELASTIKRNLRSSDLQCRWGGEEFIVMMPDTDIAGASRFSERLLQAIRSMRIDTGMDQKLSLTVSIGIAELKDMEEELDSLINRADVALYKAKRLGRDRVEQSL